MKSTEKSCEILQNRSIMVVGADHARNIEYKDDKYIDVPIYGKVTAGMPITAVQDFQDTSPSP